MPDPLQSFRSLNQYYPGSRKRRGAGAGASQTPAAPLWNERPFIKKLNGKDVEMYTIGSLARAMCKSVHSVRLYESSGYLPKTPYRLPSRIINGAPRPGRRLYTRDMILAVVAALTDRGLLDSPRIEWGEYPDLPREIAEKWRLLQSAQTTQPKS